MIYHVMFYCYIYLKIEIIKTYFPINTDYFHKINSFLTNIFYSAEVLIIEVQNYRSFNRDVIGY